MPVNLKDYPLNWKEIAKAVKDKAGWKCEFCGIAHGELVIGARGNKYKIVLTTAHIGTSKHNKRDCYNLKALCQPCHLAYDHQDHVNHARETRRKKKLEKQPLLVWMEE